MIVTLLRQHRIFSFYTESVKIQAGGWKMDITIREMKKSDWDAVSNIYKEGIETKIATFQRDAPEYAEWSKEHMKLCRFVAANNDGDVVGWAALTPVSTRCVYQGVAEVSVYVSSSVKGNGIGKSLLLHLIEASEKNGIWTLQSSIISANKASIHLHKKCGFRMIGFREKIAKDMDGIWQNIVLLERRSKEKN
jgi:L-amino acid N-acyltransferase YncA